MHPGDVLHMASVDGGVAVPRFSGKGWLELYFSLVSERRGDGSFTPPFIEASMEAPETIGRMYTQDAAEKVIAGLEAAADGLRTYLGSLPATADWVDEHLKRS
ncbi:hypothetical protein ASE03_16455 [Kitasatospora sp. Root187]|nr:hypothetical protein ASC99_23920 [Kitasatospora sp. Root107]KRB75540.1 hypothetical protein ASE03_16455 [Kitasatospora sp. Root187]